ncbi:Gfo/Idh/MocA family protein [Pseudonocardia nigra]|uniref:Gfo/Idh/MocA family protein n=1 Tax=Pseudonocardia nigra TaxID=1921578 RepID=UPI001C5E8804|nr:Gfo/Idh/MocA family oxidoreductase [Pseudonocardia nigra]
MGGPLRVGIVGAGNISAQYSACLARLPQLRVTAVCDLQADRAAALAAQHAGARVLALPELLAAADVDVVLVLTLPTTHADVALAALAAGKHVYVEKPLATSVAEGREVVKAAAGAGLRVGCAPDTVLGTGVQTARAAVDAGRIGTPHAATAFMTTPGHERWHPDPEFYYQPGGGPLLDMGPYYLTSLVHLLGPVSRVVGASSRPSATRTIGRGPRAGTTFEVAVDSTVTGILEHASGALSTLVMSFDVWAAHLPRIEVHGTGGSLSVPDPNHFAGAVELYSAAAPDAGWVDVGRTAGYVDAGRGCGLADLALALAEDRPHRAGDELALHVLDIMESVQLAADTRASVELTTTCERPAAVAGEVDLTR